MNRNEDILYYLLSRLIGVFGVGCSGVWWPSAMGNSYTSSKRHILHHISWSNIYLTRHLTLVHLLKCLNF